VARARARQHPADAIPVLEQETLRAIEGAKRSAYRAAAEPAKELRGLSAWHFPVGCQLLLYGAWEAIPYAGGRKFRMLKASKWDAEHPDLQVCRAWEGGVSCCSKIGSRAAR
jgi:hypothetical protein